MTPNPQYSGADALPQTLPIFPLAGVLLLPRGQLPLNVFEPRYLAMTRNALLGDHLIGMVQPIDPLDEDGLAPAVYATGCVGRITAFHETDDERYLITLTGVCRFVIVEELPLTKTGYRRVRAAYDIYVDDLDEPTGEPAHRARLLRALKACLPRDGGGNVDWASVERMPGDTLITSLAMMLPFAPSEKQALLEAPAPAERARVLTALMEMMAITVDGGVTEIGVQ